jgi:hypothetical protein
MKTGAVYSSWPMEDSRGTKLYGVRYRIPGEEHLLCTGLYKWQADWLVAKLNETGGYPTSNSKEQP